MFTVTNISSNRLTLSKNRVTIPKFDAIVICPKVRMHYSLYCKQKNIPQKLINNVILFIYMMGIFTIIMMI